MTKFSTYLRVLAIIYVLVSIPFALIGVLVFLERPVSSEFSNFEEAKILIERGWLPEYFPKTAMNIYEKHDIDSNKVSASFEYQPEDLEKLREICRVVVQNEVGLKLICPPFSKGTKVFVMYYSGKGYYSSDEHGL